MLWLIDVNAHLVTIRVSLSVTQSRERVPAVRKPHHHYLKLQPLSHIDTHRTAITEGSRCSFVITPSEHAHVKE